MAKYSRDLDESLVQKVKTLSKEFSLDAYDINVDVIRLNKRKTYGEVIKPNDYAKLYANNSNTVAIALCEEVITQFDEQSQNLLIENLLEQIKPQEDKEGNVKVKIEKPQINLCLSTYQRYGNVATQKLETVILTLEQMAEEEKMAKEAERAEKKERKQKKD